MAGAEAALSLAVETLSNLLINKVTFLRGVKKQVEWLKEELESMQCFLEDAAQRQAKEKSIRKWISDIRGVAQDAEDAIETFVLKVGNPRRSKRRLLETWACFPVHVYHLQRVGEQIECIKSRLEDIKKRRENYRIERMDSSWRSEENVRLLAHWQKDKHVVGLERDVELLLGKAILEERKGLSVATVAGMGGIGKSTLARKLYNHGDVTARFECRAWAAVSNEFNPKETIKELVLQLAEELDPNKKKELLEMMEKLPLPDLQHELHKRLSGRRYFIVLDDVWEETHWESLAKAFPRESTSPFFLPSFL